MDALKKRKKFYSTLLKRNLNAKLGKTFDWRAIKAFSTGNSIPQSNLQSRQVLVDTYNKRKAAIDNATSGNELVAIKINF